MPRPIRPLSLPTAVALAILATAAAGAEPWRWTSVDIRGFGYVTGLVIHPDTARAANVVYVRTDVGGGYRYDERAGLWLPLQEMFGVEQKEAFGTESVAIDPGRPDTVYYAVNGTGTGGDVIVSNDRGATWKSTGLIAKNIKLDANQFFRGSTGERLVVDPNQPGLLYFASRSNGLWRKRPDGDWTHVEGGFPAGPAGPAGCAFVVFDPTSGSAGAPSRTIYVGVYGQGVWRSEDAGTSWSSLGGEKNCVRAVLGGGTLYVSYGGPENSGGGGGVRAYAGGMWRELTPGNDHASYTGIAVDPTDPQVVLVQTSGFRVYRTTDAGHTWTALASVVADEAPWFAGKTKPGSSWGQAALVFDPNHRNRAWSTNGLGVYRCDDVTAAAPVWRMVMKGLEELVVTSIKCPPLADGADLLSTHADVVGFRHAKRDQVPNRVLQRYQWVAQGTSIDYCYSKPEMLCFVGWDEAGNDPFHGCSCDNGRTWTKFGSAIGRGGAIAMSSGDPRNLVWCPAGPGQPHVSLDGGATWRPCQGIGPSWQTTDTWWHGEIIAADRVNGKAFYFFDNGTVSASHDGGVSFQRVGGGLPNGVVMVNLRVNPLLEGDLWLTCAPNGGIGHQKLHHSSDGGKTWTDVATVDACSYVAFGKGSTATTPALYLHGRTGGAKEDHVWRSLDLGATWESLTDPAREQFGHVSAMEGDMRYPDLVYVGQGGRGIVYGRPGAQH